MRGIKDQYLVHYKGCGRYGVTTAMQPTPPKGRGWRLVSVSSGGNGFFHYWHRRSKQPLPANQYPYS